MGNVVLGRDGMLTTNTIVLVFGTIENLLVKHVFDFIFFFSFPIFRYMYKNASVILNFRMFYNIIFHRQILYTPTSSLETQNKAK